MGLFDWIRAHLSHSLAIQAFLMYLQIPHMLWVGDAFIAKSGWLYGISTPLDFLFYGIDLIEWIGIVNITLTIIAVMKHRKKNIK